MQKKYMNGNVKNYTMVKNYENAKKYINLKKVYEYK